LTLNNESKPENEVAMIPLSQIFARAARERPTVRGPIEAQKKPARFCGEEKKKNRQTARRLYARPAFSITPSSSSQSKFRGGTNAKRVLALLGIFLLLAVGTLNQRHEIPPAADDAQLLHTPERPNHLSGPQLSPNIGLKVNPERLEELAENYDGKYRPMLLNRGSNYPLGGGRALPEQEAALKSQRHHNELAANAPSVIRNADKAESALAGF
jgi:hypothetical protein